MARKFFFLIFVSLVQISFAQNKRANIWYFGTQAGIDFNSGGPVALTNSALSTGEGTAVLCDTAGNLLFYTDGITVYGSNHIQMPNGFGLAGGNSSSQSALIVPDPGNSNQYYVFTVASDNTGGLNYSLVDMTLNAGIGDVTVKNTPLVAVTGEKLTGFQKPGTNDIWIVTHEWGNANFNSFLLTSTGLNAPVVSTVGQVHTGSGNAIGYMKISPAGDKIALALSRSNNFELFDFDPATGIVTNPIVLPATAYTYGIEFSSDGKILYAAEFANKIYQYDLTLGSAAAIIASQLLLQPQPVGIEIGSLQMAPDGKIYVAKNSSTFVGVINNPDTLGQACNYVDNGFSIAPKQGIEGLPNFIQSIFTQSPAIPVALFTAPNHICPGTCTDFTNLSVNAVSFLWSFPGANPSTSTDANPVNICYNTPGTYPVQLIASNVNGSDTLNLNNFITVYPNPAPQGITQNGDTLFANPGANSYQWYYNGSLINGATDDYYVATISGNYNVVATDPNGCEVEAAIFDVIAAINSISNLEPDITVFPSPASDWIEVKFAERIQEGIIVSTFNSLGETTMKDLVLEKGVSHLRLDVHGLLPGLYWLEVCSGELTWRTRFVKQ